jgi:hypothetical protein
MTQVLPAALVAPTQASLSADAVGYLIRTIAGVEGSFVSNTGTAGAISKVASTGYFYATTGITAPDDGGVLEWYISNAGSPGTFLSAVAIEPAPNQADQAAGIRAALGLASPNMDTQLGNIPTTPLLAANYTAPDNAGIAAIKAKTDNLPVDPADQSALADLINTRLAAADYIAPNNTPVLAAIELLPTGPEIATAVEAALIAEGDGQKLLEAIQGAVQELFNTGTDVPIATLVGAIADRITADHGTGAYTTANLSAVALQATLEAVQAKTNALPDDPADQSELAQLIAAIPQGLTTQQNTRLTQLWQQAGFDSAVPVVRDKEGSVITETIGTTVITHTATNAGDTVTTERQP